MEVKHGEASSADVEGMSPKIIDRKSIPRMQVYDETAKTKRPAVQVVEELFMEQDRHEEGSGHRGADVPLHQTDQFNCRGVDPHAEPVVEQDTATVTTCGWPQSVGYSRGWPRRHCKRGWKLTRRANAGR